MSLEQLETADEVVAALGGNPSVEALTESKPTAVCNWVATGSFPPKTYVVMTMALAALGKTAPAALWRMKLPADTESAA